MNAAAPLMQNISDEISSRLGCVITQWYGMTEASPSVVSQKQNHVHVRNSIGKLLPGIELQILDEQDRGEFVINPANCLEWSLKAD
jgi:4-coumarate--CoA ligase